MPSSTSQPARFIQTVKVFLKNHLDPEMLGSLQNMYARALVLGAKCMYPYGRFVKTPINLFAFGSRSHRRLEIGPGAERIPGFETANVIWGRQVDFVTDASKKLPFKSNTFELIYASHILEHIPWYQTQTAVSEWVRVLKSGGHLEIWVPNGLLIAKSFVNAELGLDNEIDKDGWYKFNDTRDPCLWANGRLFSYGDGTGQKSHQNWHVAIFSPRFLQELLAKCGLVEVEALGHENVRGYDHGWINLGVRGRKP